MGDTSSRLGIIFSMEEQRKVLLAQVLHLARVRRDRLRGIGLGDLSPLLQEELLKHDFEPLPTGDTTQVWTVKDPQPPVRSVLSSMVSVVLPMVLGFCGGVIIASEHTLPGVLVVVLGVVLGRALRKRMNPKVEVAAQPRLALAGLSRGSRLVGGFLNEYRRQIGDTTTWPMEAQQDLAYILGQVLRLVNEREALTPATTTSERDARTLIDDALAEHIAVLGALAREELARQRLQMAGSAEEGRDSLVARVLAEKAARTEVERLKD